MWVVGQRVIAEFEPELGLGIVVEVTGNRFLEVLFPGAEIARRYSQKGAPLRRLVLSSGQRAKTKDGQTFTISEAKESGGLLEYRGDGVTAWEYELDHVIEDTNPVSRLLMGSWGSPRTFDLRMKAWELRRRSLDPDLRGLIGPRVSLLPHQLYIAHEIAKREYPRVLLADEVGLGKTIEAGLIFSSLRSLGRAERVLVIVPEALKHQWLAEMYRRFNEMFSLVDEDRSEQEELSQGASAFNQNQRIICSLDFLLENPHRLEEAVTEKWDLLIVDEAHHLEWSPEEPSAEWDIVRLLSTRARGLLLLTATPEHRGTETEFGLLHLVDPERFPDFKKFEKEMRRMHETAQLARKIQEGERGKKVLSQLEEHFDSDKDLATSIEEYAEGGPPEALLRNLIDRHGTGRVLIRNRRHRLRGFPERRFDPRALKPSEAWRAFGENLAEDVDNEKLFTLATGHGRLPKGEIAQGWFESRASWLLDLLKTLDGVKVLLICATPRRAVELQNWLREKSSIRTAIFHEDLEIVERDRQAAWFSEPEGAQVLLCSEIGGEGRNFQFAHHLVLFDLPLHADILEQRIGRLDRIGQMRPITIHVPYLEDTPEEVVLRWYAEGLESFTQPWGGGAAIDTLRDPLMETCRAYLPRSKSYPKRADKLKKLIERSRETAEAIRRKQRESVDILVDLNSFDEAKGKALANRIHQIDESEELKTFMDQAFEHFGVEIEDFDGGDTLKITAHSLTFVESFPGLTAHGERLATYDRAHALAREELAFLTWDHPIVQGAMSLVLEGDAGRASIGAWQNGPRKYPLLIELLYVLQTTAPAALEVERDLPLRAMRVFATLDGTLVEAPPGLGEATLNPVGVEKFKPALDRLRERLPAAVDKATLQVQKRAAALVEQAAKARLERLGEEHTRFEHLARVNPLITKQELAEHKEKIAAGAEAIRTASPRLEGIRLLFSE